MSYSPTSIPSPTTVSDGGTINVPTNSIINDTSSQSPSATLFIVVIVMASAIIILAFIFLLIRFLHIRKLRAAAASSVPLSRERINSNCFNGRNGSSTMSILDSLPLFSYGTVTGNLSGGDCAVCLSKFEAQDQLRLLPLCCHAFHARCIDTWLSSHMTCPLCRSSANPTDSDVFNEILTAEVTRDSISGNSDNSGGRSFRLEIGSVGNRRSSSVSGRRSYSIGQFEYIVNDVRCEVPVDRTHRRGVLEFGTNTIAADHKEPVVGVLPPAAPHLGERFVEEIDRSWLRDYVDRLGSSLSFSTRTLSIRSSGRFFTGSSRRSDIGLPVEDLEANRIGEEISELFRWLSGA